MDDKCLDIDDEEVEEEEFGISSDEISELRTIVSDIELMLDRIKEIIGG